MNILIVTFPSVHYALRGETLLKEAEIEHKTVPVPRDISSSCGLSIKIPYKYLDKIKNDGLKLNYEALYYFDSELDIHINIE